MPLYEYRCGCGSWFERQVPLARYREPQTCDCGLEAQKVIGAPRVQSDCIDPIFGFDGKKYDSLSAYRQTMKPENNPKGERYYEIGPGEQPKFKPKEFDRKQRRDDIKAAIADIKAGRLPPPPVACPVT